MCKTLKGKILLSSIISGKSILFFPIFIKIIYYICFFSFKKKDYILHHNFLFGFGTTQINEQNYMNVSFLTCIHIM